MAADESNENPRNDNRLGAMGDPRTNAANLLALLKHAAERNQPNPHFGSPFSGGQHEGLSAEQLRSMDRRTDIAKAIADSIRERMASTNTPSISPEAEARLDLLLQQISAAGSWEPPRAARTPSDFFAPTEVVVSSYRELLSQIYLILDKHSHHGLVWRGQQDARWGIQSSLTRALLLAGTDPTDAQMSVIEEFHLAEAEMWGLPSLDEQTFLATLQHEGAPTRLIDVSNDPSVSSWFAVEEGFGANAGLNEQPGRLIIWGTHAALPEGEERLQRTPLPPGRFWKDWDSPQLRRENDWGTGRRLWQWAPPAFNERMRAQRAAFLVDAEPLPDEKILSEFEKTLGEPWTAPELAGATRILGMPTAPQRKAPVNRERIVPMFSIKIAAEAKPEIRQALESQGLTERTIYPDRMGFITKLKRVGAGSGSWE